MYSSSASHLRGVILWALILSTIGYVAVGARDLACHERVWSDKDTLYADSVDQSQGGAVLLRSRDKSVRLVALHNITFRGCDYTTGWVLTNTTVQVVEVQTGRVANTIHVFRFWPTEHAIRVSGKLVQQIHGVRGEVNRWKYGGHFDISSNIEAVAFVRWSNVIDMVVKEQLRWQNTVTNWSSL